MKNINIKKKILIITIIIFSIILVAFGGIIFKHHHRFSQEIIDEVYLKEEATCTTSAIYYYSCKCGEKGSKTFNYGKTIPHIYEKKIISDMYLYSEATRESAARYCYACAICERKGVKTFKHGTRLQDEWGYNYYIDNEFGEKTNEWYITTLESLDGTFENSATDNAKLLVEILYDCDDTISIFLHEYAREDDLVKNSSSRYIDYYKIVIKNEKEIKYEARGQMHPGGDRIYIIDKYHKSVLDLMKTSKTLKFYIEFEDSPTTQYRFDVDMNNFNDALKDMMR